MYTITYMQVLNSSIIYFNYDLILRHIGWSIALLKLSCLLFEPYIVALLMQMMLNVLFIYIVVMLMHVKFLIVLLVQWLHHYSLDSHVVECPILLCDLTITILMHVMFIVLFVVWMHHCDVDKHDISNY
jgi:hypothetical protein